MVRKDLEILTRVFKDTYKEMMNVSEEQATIFLSITESIADKLDLQLANFNKERFLLEITRGSNGFKA